MLRSITAATEKQDDITNAGVAVLTWRMMMMVVMRLVKPQWSAQQGAPGGALQHRAVGSNCD